MAKPLCAMDRDGIWCAVVGQPTENYLKVETVCGEAILLPYGLKRRKPTCEKCRSALSKETGE